MMLHKHRLHPLECVHITKPILNVAYFFHSNPCGANHIECYLCDMRFLY